MKKPTPAELAQFQHARFKSEQDRLEMEIRILQGQSLIWGKARVDAERLVDDLKKLEMPDPSQPQQ